MNTLSRPKRAIFFYISFAAWLGSSVFLFVYLLERFFLLKGQVTHLFTIPFILLAVSLYFSLDLYKKRKWLFLVFVLVFFATIAYPAFWQMKGLLGHLSRNAAPGLAYLAIFIFYSLYQLVLILAFFIYERVAKNAKKVSKILVPVIVPIAFYLLYRLTIWFFFIRHLNL